MQRALVSLALCGFVVVVALAPLPAGSTLPWTESVLATFTSGPTGLFPAGDPVADRTGSLYGTTQDGGAGDCDGGCGTIYKISPPGAGRTTWTRSVIYAFAGYTNAQTDGAEPLAGLITDRGGALYGTTYQGGVNSPNGQGGVVFKLTPPVSATKAWAESVLYAFSGKDGLLPSAALLADAHGALYGTTQAGGASDNLMDVSGYGTVFKLTPPAAGTTPWTESVLYSFLGGSDGGGPFAGVVADARGNLYGTTLRGGANDAGTVFTLTQVPGSTAWTESVVYAFKGGIDGGIPQGGLIVDGSGVLYGTAVVGGVHGNGVVFGLVPPVAGGTWTEHVLYSFQGGADGARPQGSLIADAWGRLYGATQQGGSCILGPRGCGTIFRLTPPLRGAAAWTKTVLHAFSAGTDGDGPNGVVSDGKGGLYGATCCGGSAANGGTVFELCPVRVLEPAAQRELCRRPFCSRPTCFRTPLGAGGS